ncbi:MAG: phytanoyl-CoA dioxygenase family protein [Planctomycetes bacterium]|nr:phytanoyl-CoA dioxygenase family protein [Planctomycetota bacterium]
MHSQTQPLKTSHHPVGDTFPCLETRSEIAQYKLNEKQIQSYRDNGYLDNVSIINQEMVKALGQGLDAIVYGENTSVENLIGLDGDFTPIKRGEAVPMIYFQGAWMTDQSIHDLMFHPSITVPVSQLLQTDKVIFWHDQVFYKPAQHGGNVCWHQDYSYWQRTSPCHHITVWIGLDDSTVENGCLQVIPQSHQWGLLDEVELLEGGMDDLKSQLSPEQAESFHPQPLPMNTGNCSFHDPYTIHGSMPNQSNQHRRAIILNFMADDVVSNDGDCELMPGYPPIPKGEKIRGDLWPVVYDKSTLK